MFIHIRLIYLVDLFSCTEVSTPMFHHESTYRYTHDLSLFVLEYPVQILAGISMAMIRRKIMVWLYTGALTGELLQ